MKNNKSLKPCPFCGSDNLRYSFYSYQGVIECRHCGAVGPDAEKAADPECSVNAACEIWNHRYEFWNHSNEK